MFDCFYKNTDASDRIAASLAHLLKGRIPVFLCLGNARLHYDSLGCRVGTLLESSPFSAYGTLSDNIDSGKVYAAVDFIRIMHPKNPIIAIDAAVGGMSEIGKIAVSSKGLCCGTANNLNLPCLGDFSVTAIVTTDSLWDFCITPSHKRRLCDEMASIIAQAVNKLAVI